MTAADVPLASGRGRRRTRLPSAVRAPAALASRIRSSRADGVRPGLSGTKVNPHCTQARKAAANSGPFGSTTARVSPGPKPWDWRRETHRSAKERGSTAERPSKVTTSRCGTSFSLEISREATFSMLAELPEKDAGGDGADDGTTVADEQDQFL